MSMCATVTKKTFQVAATVITCVDKCHEYKIVECHVHEMNPYRKASTCDEPPT